MGRARRAFAEFFRLEAAGGIVLICAAVLALVCVNTGLADTYKRVARCVVGRQRGDRSVSKNRCCCGSTMA
jgi:NhaA family Na+:H+ antiporter